MTASAFRLIRHSPVFACPVCGGNTALAKGRGIRCAGFSLDTVAYCTREEYAGNLPLEIQTEPPAYKHHLFGPCACGCEHGAGSPEPHLAPAAPPLPPYISIEDRHAIYSAALDLLELRAPARADLRRRGLGDTAIDGMSYKSLPWRGGEHKQLLRALVSQFGEPQLLRCPGFTDREGRLALRTATASRDGYLVMYTDYLGRFTGLQYRLIGGSYETARGTEARHIYHVAGVPQPGNDLYITEGATKANVAHHLSGRCFFAVAGQSLKAEHVEVIQSLAPARVVVSLDQETNVNTERARERWLRILWSASLPTYNAVWEGADLGGPKGIDDLFFAGGSPRLRAAHFVASAFGEKRVLHETAEKGAVVGGMALVEGRRLVERAIGDFIGAAGRQ